MSFCFTYCLLSVYYSNSLHFYYCWFNVFLVLLSFSVIVLYCDSLNTFCCFSCLDFSLLYLPTIEIYFSLIFLFLDCFCSGFLSYSDSFDLSFSIAFVLPCFLCPAFLLHLFTILILRAFFPLLLLFFFLLPFLFISVFVYYILIYPFYILSLSPPFSLYFFTYLAFFLYLVVLLISFKFFVLLISFFRILFALILHFLLYACYSDLFCIPFFVRLCIYLLFWFTWPFFFLFMSCFYSVYIY